MLNFVYTCVSLWRYGHLCAPEDRKGHQIWNWSYRQWWPLRTGAGKNASACPNRGAISPVPQILNIKYFVKDLVSLIPAQRIIPSSIPLVHRN